MARDSRISVTVSSGACIYAAIMLLAVPFRWFIAWIAAAGWHELCHFFAVVLCNKKIECVDVHVHGAKIQTAALSSIETVFCALSGPLGGLLLFFLCQIFPRVAICALFQTVFNLLPIFPLDGGRAVQALLHLFLPEAWVRTISGMIRTLLFGMLITVSILSAFVWNLGIFPLLFTVALAICTGNRKIPCK